MQSAQARRKEIKLKQPFMILKEIRPILVTMGMVD
jgi:hypothetical protein